MNARTAKGNQIRELLSEFGIVIPKGIDVIAMEDGENGLPGTMRQLLERLRNNLKKMDSHVNELEKQIKSWYLGNDISRKLEAIPRIGPITASAIVATAGNALNLRTAGRWRRGWV